MCVCLWPEVIRALRTLEGMEFKRSWTLDSMDFQRTTIPDLKAESKVKQIIIIMRNNLLSTELSNLQLEQKVRKEAASLSGCLFYVSVLSYGM